MGCNLPVVIEEVLLHMDHILLISGIFEKSGYGRHHKL